MRSSNPALSRDTFRQFGFANQASDVMTVQGVIIKTVLSLCILLFTAGWVWTMFYNAGSNPAVAYPWMMGGLFGGFIAAMVTIFKKEWSGITTPIYAALEGLFIGGISAVFESAYSGIVMQAAALTFGTLFCMLAAYQTGLIRATEKFKAGVVAATGGIAVVYFISIVLSFFGVSIPFLFGNGIGGIAFSLVVVTVAALNFIIDFDFIEQGARAGAPKYMEWYGSFALMVTLVWLYIEFLRLLSKLRSR